MNAELKCRACGEPAGEGVVAAYSCPRCGERNPYAPPKGDDEPSQPFEGTSYGREIEDGRSKLDELRREAGYDPHSDEPPAPDALDRYVDLLESTVVGQHAAMGLISKTFRR